MSRKRCVASVPVACGSTNAVDGPPSIIDESARGRLNILASMSGLTYATPHLLPVFIPMKALVKESRAPGFVLKEVPVPTIRADEVLIKVRRAGVCGTDVHIHDWDAWASGRCKPSFTVGHEFAGEVAEVGSLVTDVTIGDRVTAEGHIVCGRCHLCRTGNGHVCPNTKIIGVDRDGCFAEFIAMPASNVWHLDDNIPFEIGGIHDPMGNAFHTALHDTNLPGKTVLVTFGRQTVSKPQYWNLTSQAVTGNTQQ
jgi:hypothetical protein